MPKRVAAWLALGLCGMGCLSIHLGDRVLQSETAATLSAKIVEGKTTKPEIKALLGAPAQVSFSASGLEIYHYELTVAKAKLLDVVPVALLGPHGYEGTKTSLDVLFAKNNVVTQYTLATAAVVIEP